MARPTATDPAATGLPPARHAAPVVVRLLLLALLPLLAAVLYERGQQYDPTLLNFKSAGHPLTTFLPKQVENWRREEAVRSFDKANLYEYVDGHAEYFLSAGFRALAVAEYRLPTDTQQPSAVLDLYDMGEPLNAFGTLMDEIGTNGQPVAVGEAGFQNRRGLGFISGPYYVKLAAFADDLPLLAVAQAVERALHQGAGPSTGKLSLDGLFPDLGTVVATRFIKENYHGWNFLQRVVERSFKRADGVVIQAFSVTGTPEQMATLEQAMVAFFRQEGTAVTERREEGMRILQIADRYEGDWIVVPLARGWLGIFHPWEDAWKIPLKAFAPHG
ncbi:MAG: hypothetical protein HQL87_13500 [Magnetococcales bacterium]|nr:hypothetical protein [Magnetococcales bacterium]